MVANAGDSQVSAPPEQSVSAPPSTAQSMAVDNQVGAGPTTDEAKAANDEVMGKYGFSKAQDFFGPEDDQDKADNRTDGQDPRKETDDQVQKDSKDNDVKEPEIKYPTAEGDLSKLSPDKLNDMKEIAEGGAKECTPEQCYPEDIQRGLQQQADQFGKNPDGSPKVAISAYQTKEENPTTSFYATFGNSATDHEAANYLIDGARRYGTDFPSDRAGLVGYVRGGNGPRT